MEKEKLIYYNEELMWSEIVNILDMHNFLIYTYKWR